MPSPGRGAAKGVGLLGKGIMTDEEMKVLEFLRASPEAKFGRREISRRAVHRRVFEENPHWADVALVALVARSEIVLDTNGLYQLKGGES